MTPITQHESEQASASAVGSVHDKDLAAAIALRRPGKSHITDVIANAALRGFVRVI